MDLCQNHFKTIKKLEEKQPLRIRRVVSRPFVHLQRDVSAEVFDKKQKREKMP